ncbi:benzoate 4-monooxygenase cytochrome P450 [Melanomma pulvis-pyrius CBS 109.77]|uniref:Benzoate 4-monooxygenase cytochrome P450 n=1 Tax=Melanomma pulvis-pyrius CBS 109.77 TaxID=1314802 RepID=A0A6A6XTU2_9PLEO|nr:benzoate 4-monooxygenase cytochrome P450 [Melanomma pulvis-pyrius CBS 109.77]
MFYNVYLHPLRKYPGPKLYACSIIPITRQRLRGRALIVVTALHKKYGPVVRLAPNELSYIDIQAWKDVYGHRKPGQLVWRKDPAQAGPEEAGTPGIFRSEGQEHTQLKKVFNHAFSDKALRDQEDLIRTHCKTLVSVLLKRAEKQKVNPSAAEATIDMVKFWNFATFDIMGDLTFGEPLDLLVNSEYTPWVYAMIGHVKSISLMHAIARWPILAAGMKALLPASIKKLREDHFNFCVERVEKRIALKTARPDFWSLIVEAGTQREINKAQLYATMSDFMFAGTETTATALSGITFLLCQNPEKMTKLVKEIRQYKVFEELNLTTLQNLPFLNACCDEALRLYPPVPVGNMRLAPKGGSFVMGSYVPEGTTVELAQFSAYHCEYNFKNPESFAPERFLPDPPKEYASDSKGMLNPFGVGPRACIGRNLAMHAFRMLFVTLVWHFDVSLVNPNLDWLNQEVHELWEKNPLPVKLDIVHNQERNTC